jgi:hypothetical protein
MSGPICKLDVDVIELLAQNLSRLNEENDTDKTGVFYILSRRLLPESILYRSQLFRYRCT